MILAPALSTMPARTENQSSTPVRFFETQGTMLAVEKCVSKDSQRKQDSKIFRPPFFDRLF